jgi:hypothetical protein
LQHAFEIAAAVLDFPEQAFERLMTLRQRTVESCLRAFEFGRRLHQCFGMRADRAGERIGTRERAICHFAELRHLVRDVLDSAAELTEIGVEVRVDRREIVAGL